MRSAPMSAWLRPEHTDLWEQVDRRTYGTIDQDEDVLWYAHAKVEQRALPRDRAEPAPAKRRTVVKKFPSAARHRKVG